MERRRYQRADANVLIKVRLLETDRQAGYFSKISNAASAAVKGKEVNLDPNAADSSQLPQHLVTLAEDSDSMERLFDSKSGDGFHGLKYKQINLSGSGVRFLCDTKCNVKDLVELRIVLPVEPPIPIYIYAEVVRVLESDGGFAAGAEFIAVSDEIRRDIVQFVNALLDA
ncbi:MAG: PilZ domain-containing protein [Candidatus Magnetominusculus sp. LBB02]|nr:PilZ domain-containing protein [Candidatus Magnetominusculus sp. LBB02]